VGLGRPRARQRFAGGSDPSSEAEIRPRGRQALERGGDSPEGASSPRARRRLRGAVPGPRARRKFTRGVPRPAVWWATTASSGRGPFSALGYDHAECALWFVGLFVLLLLFFERGVFPRY
jgi:hypothetical protein